MSVDVTQAGGFIYINGELVEVTQAGTFRYEIGNLADVTQAGIIWYEQEVEVNVTQAGILYYEQSQELHVTQAGRFIFVEGFHRNPLLRFVTIGATFANLAVTVVYPEWSEITYTLALLSDPSTILVTETKLSSDPTFGSFVLTGLTTSETYIATAQAVTPAGPTDISTLEFVAEEPLLPNNTNAFISPGYGEPVHDTTMVCWSADIEGVAVALYLINPYTGSTVLLADEAALVGLFCINVDWSSYDDEWYILRLRTRDEFGLEYEWDHPGFNIDNAEIGVWYEEIPEDISDWGIWGGTALTWNNPRNSELVCSGDPALPLTRKLTQDGNPNSFVVQQTAIGPVPPLLYEKARAASKASIWADASLFGYLFGAEFAAAGVYSAINLTSEQRIEFAVSVNHEILGGVIGATAGAGVGQGQFRWDLSIWDGETRIYVDSDVVGIVAVASHPCLFDNDRPTKWPYYLMAEHEVLDAVNGVVKVRGWLGGGYGLKFEETLNTGIDLTNYLCNAVAVTSDKTDNLQNDPGHRQFDNLSVVGTVGVCGPPPPPPPPEIPPEEEPEPTPPTIPEFCPIVIIVPVGEDASTIIAQVSESCPGDHIVTIEDSNVHEPIVVICPPGFPDGGIPGGGIIVIPPDPSTPPPVVLQPRIGRLIKNLPMMTVVSDGVTAILSTFGVLNKSLPAITLSADGSAIIDADLDVDVPDIDLDSEGEIS